MNIVKPNGPPVFHNAGDGGVIGDNFGHAFWNAIKSKQFAQPRANPVETDVSDLQIVICHNYSFNPITALSLDFAGIHDYKVLNVDINLKWRHVYKIQELYKFLKQKENRKKYTMHLDASDVLVLSRKADILNRFNSINCDAIFNGEKNSWPNSAMGSRPIENTFLRSVNEYDKYEADRMYGTFNLSDRDLELLRTIEQFEEANAKTDYAYLNSGCYIGKTDYILYLLEKCLSAGNVLDSDRFNDSDQFLFRNIFQEEWPRMQIDYERKIFQTTKYTTSEELMQNFNISLSDKISIFLKLLPYKKRTFQKRFKIIFIRSR